VDSGAGAGAGEGSNPGIGLAELDLFGSLGGIAGPVDSGPPFADSAGACDAGLLSDGSLKSGGRSKESLRKSGFDSGAAAGRGGSKRANQS